MLDEKQQKQTKAKAKAADQETKYNTVMFPPSARARMKKTVVFPFIAELRVAATRPMRVKWEGRGDIGSHAHNGVLGNVSAATFLPLLHIQLNHTVLC